MVVAAIGWGAGAQLLSWPVLVVDIRADGVGVSAATPDTPPLLLPLSIVAQGSELRFDLAMMVHILADIHVPGGSMPQSSGVAVLPVPIQPSHGAMHHGQARLPTHVLAAGHGT